MKAGLPKGHGKAILQDCCEYDQARHRDYNSVNCHPLSLEIEFHFDACQFDHVMILQLICLICECLAVD